MHLLILAHNADALASCLNQPGLQLPPVICCRDPRELPDTSDVAWVMAEPALLDASLQRQDKAFPNVEWVHSTFAGVECLLQHARERNWTLTRMNRGFEQAIAEYVVGHVLAHAYHHAAFHKLQREHRWDMRLAIRLKGKTMGLLGTGAITRQLPPWARSLGLGVLGVNRRGQNPGDLDAVYRTADLLRAAPMADIWVNALPLTPETDGLLNGDFFEALGSDSMLIHLGRGPTVQEDALMAWLASNPRAYAVCDVFREEPLPETSPLWDLPNLFITPHMAAKSQPEDVACHWLDNWQKRQQGQRLDGLVDLQQGY
jgi:phosphoglycerate dehydrogenase-like enzyme